MIDCIQMTLQTFFLASKEKFVNCMMCKIKTTYKSIIFWFYLHVGDSHVGPIAYIFHQVIRSSKNYQKLWVYIHEENVPGHNSKRILSEISILFLKVIFLESFKRSKFIPFLSITAAETTGPARHPLPTSSTPAVINLFFNLSFRFFCLLSFLSQSKPFFFVLAVSLKKLGEM